MNITGSIVPFCSNRPKIDKSALRFRFRGNPGLGRQSYSTTTRELIKKGAKLCEGVEDILSEFENLFPASNRPKSAAETGVLPALELNENEKLVYDSLGNEEISIDEVIRNCTLPSSAVNVALFSLEMKRLVKQLPGKLFVRNK